MGSDITDLMAIEIEGTSEYLEIPVAQGSSHFGVDNIVINMKCLFICICDTVYWFAMSAEVPEICMTFPPTN